MVTIGKEYFLDFKPPMKIGDISLNRKKAIELSFKGITVDYSPLQGLNTEDFDEQLNLLKNLNLEKEPGSFCEIDELTNGFAPAMRFSLECLFLENLTKDKKFFEKNNIKENALYIPGQSKLDSKFECIKVKIGRDDIKKEIETVNQLSKSGKLRLDANSSLSLSELENFWSGLNNKESIQYFEDPLKNPNELIKVSKEIPLALDESLEEYENDPPMNIGHIVLKPSVKKGIFGSLKLIEQMNKRDIKIVISSAFETPKMMKYLYYLANTQDAISPTYHGLDTLKFFDI